MKITLFCRKCKAAHDRLLSKKSAAGTKSLTLASQTYYHVGSGLVDSSAIAPTMINEVENIYEGSFGVCAKMLLHGVPVCVKTLKCESSSSNSTKANLLHEATMLSKLRHEHMFSDGNSSNKGTIPVSHALLHH